ncbi:MAG: septal ring factor EnvC (AmiA/AmiB activator) [Candidatus Latescibacterota bacterium]|jgi:septal ring factor EnvC (AmiA/AmiB activator)
MILELITFVMFALILVLKYGAVTRMVRLKQRLREAEGRCRKQKDNFRLYQAERMAVEREQNRLIRQRRLLKGELTKLNAELDMFKGENRGIIEELIRLNGRIDPTLVAGGDIVQEDPEP